MKRVTLEDLRATVWAGPAVAGVVSFVVAALLVRLRGDAGGVAELPWTGDRGAASAVLQVIAASVITATSLTFSLLVVALQLASQQFSPRLLREFARDRVIQVVLAVLLSAFVFALTTLLALDEARPMPHASIAVAFGMGLASMAALLAFLAHIIRALRVDTMMVAVHEATIAALRDDYRAYDAPGLHAVDATTADGGHLVSATRSGYLQSVDVPALVAVAASADVFVRVGVRAGDHITRGTPVATWHPASPPHDGDLDEDALLACFDLGYERTLEQDAALGFRLLSDIAVKALSPAINDPATAAHAIGFLADLLVYLCGRDLVPIVQADGEGVPRAVVPERDLRYYLDLACGPVRRFARAEPVVLVALMAMLRDVAVATRDDEQRAEVRRQVDLICCEMSDQLIAEDRERVDDAAKRVHQALRGDVASAYADRSGETRST